MYFIKAKKKSKKILQEAKLKLGYYIDSALTSNNRPINTVVTTGFWRSGTTWLQQTIARIIDAKTVFEPLGPDLNIDIKQSKGNESFSSRNFRNAYMPYIDPNDRDNDFDKYIEKCLKSTLKENVTRRLRESVTESFKPRVVCKFVRGQLLLPWMAIKHPNIPLIHIYRDPRSVVASIIRDGWGYWFGDFSLSKHLLELNDGRVSFFNKWADEIKKYDQDGKIAKITAFWCLTEKFISETSIISNFHRCSYDTITKDYNFQHIYEFLEQYGFTCNYIDFSEIQNSPTTNKKRVFKKIQHRKLSWKTELSSSQIDTIERIVLAFNMESAFQSNLT